VYLLLKNTVHLKITEPAINCLNVSNTRGVHLLLLSQRYTPTTNFTFDTTVTFVTNPGSATLRRKPEIMRSTPLWGGYSTLPPESRKTSNQERRTPYLLSFLLRCRDQSHSAPSGHLAATLLPYTTLLRLFTAQTLFFINFVLRLQAFFWILEP
jgi:hypothetical protein